MNRCVICDYTEEEGSALLDKSPTRNNKVRIEGDDFICDDCSEAANDCYAELAELDDEVEGS